MSFPLDTTDALGQAVRLDSPPRRIVSLVPSQTELLADLGLDEEVVGLTRFCIHPEGWKQRKAIVGGTKQVRVEKVRALAPDLVLANREENTRADVEALAAFAPVYVTDVATVAEALAMIRTVGLLVGREAEADALTTDIETGFASLSSSPSLRAAYLIWRAPWMAVGGDTFVSDVMARAGFANVFAERTRYPEVTAADLRAARPDVLLLSSEPYPFREKHLVEVEALAADVPAVLVDGELFSWYGSRMRRAPAYLAALRDRLANHPASAVR